MYNVKEIAEGCGAKFSEAGILTVKNPYREEAFEMFVFGNDECWDNDEFYQYGVMADQKDGVKHLYHLYYHVEDDNGDEIPLDCIDYSEPSSIYVESIVVDDSGCFDVAFDTEFDEDANLRIGRSPLFL